MTPLSQNVPLQCGDWVWVQYGKQRVLAQVIEDRGPLGKNREQLLRVRLLLIADEPIEFELPASKTDPGDGARSALTTYLCSGGLVEILGSNIGGRNPSRVWLDLDRGNLPTHSFTDGVVGGIVPPSLALHDGRISEPKQGEVLTFLTRLGFSHREASKIIRVVGIAP